MNRAAASPDWAALLALASRQGGFFSTAQAHNCGFSNQLLRHHVGNGRLLRVRRRIYRAMELPESAPRLYQAWLATRGAGCFSHGTALWLHGLRPEIQEPYHMILPESWRAKRQGLPPWVWPHWGSLDPAERIPLQGVMATTVERALRDAGEEPGR